jgi:hypothetical protein
MMCELHKCIAWKTEILLLIYNFGLLAVSISTFSDFGSADIFRNPFLLNFLFR